MTSSREQFRPESRGCVAVAPGDEQVAAPREGSPVGNGDAGARASRGTLWAGRPDILAVALLVALVAGYSALTFNRYVPVQEGWFQYYTQLMDQGRFPYRDFYLHLQPLFILFTSLLNHWLGPEFIVLRAYGVAERCVLSVLLFLWLRKHFGLVETFGAVVVSVFLYSSFNVDLPYSYYQTSLLVTLVSGLFMSRALDLGGAGTGRGRGCLALAGVFAAVAFFTKQSSGLLFLVLYAGIITIHVPRREGVREAFLKCGCFAAGFCVVACGVMFWLVHNHAVDSYYDIVYRAASSKGSVPAILAGFLPRLLGHALEPRVMLLLLALLPVLVLAIRPVRVPAPGRPDDGSCTWHLWVVAVPVALAYVAPYLVRAVPARPGVVVAMHYAILLVTFLGVAGVVLVLTCRWCRDCANARNNSRLFLALFALTWMYAHGMSGVLEIHGILPAGPLLMLLLLDRLDGQPVGRVGRWLFLPAAVTCVTLVAAARYANPCYWWGWGEPDVRTATCSTSIPMLRGMYVSQETKNAYESVCNLVHAATREGGEVFTFPHIVFFNVITGTSSANFAPVTYFDVCSDKYAAQAADYLVREPPKVIIFMAFPEDAWQVHEDLFRSGRRSAQREIVAAILRMEDAGLYSRALTVSVRDNYPIHVLIREPR